MRALLVNDIFDEIGDELYALNSLSRLFQDKDLHAFLPIVSVFEYAAHKALLMERQSLQRLPPRTTR